VPERTNNPPRVAKSALGALHTVNGQRQTIKTQTRPVLSGTGIFAGTPHSLGARTSARPVPERTNAPPRVESALGAPPVTLVAKVVNGPTWKEGGVSGFEV